VPFVRPANKILVAGSPLVEELITEGTSVKPGMLVIKGTGDHQVQPAGDGAKNPLGVADYDARYKITDAYPDKSPVRVLKGSIVVVVTLASGNNVSKGQALVCAPNGEVKAAADIAVSVPSGTTTVTSNAAQPDLQEIGSIPPYGVIVGFAEESVDASAEAKPLMMRLVI
jgi:hypothetical protein